MFKTIRKLFGKRAADSGETAEQFEQDAPASFPIPQSGRAMRVDAQPAPVARNASGAPPSSIGVPLKAIVGRLPADLMQRVRQVDVGEAEIFVPTQKILGQISTGAVRISFGELRQLAPPGTFTAENDRDRTLVELPLHEVLSRLNPGLLMRRPVQKHVEVPADVVGPFGGQTKVVISTAPTKGAPAQPARPAPPQPVTPPPLRVPAPQVAPVQPPSAPLPTQPVFARIRPSAPIPRSAPVPPAPAPVQPVREAAEEPIFARPRFAAPPAPIQPVFTPIAPTPEAEAPVEEEAIQMPQVQDNGAVPAPITPIAPEPEPEPEPIRFSMPPAQPAPQPVVPVTTGETRFITVSLAELSPAWPEAIQTEIYGLKISNSWIGLPLGAVEGVIKTGKISFPWKALRSWVKPPIPVTASAYDTTMLDLPLKIVTPLFMAELRATRTQKAYSVDDNIPDLFFNSQPVETAPNAPVIPVMPVAQVPLPTPPVALPQVAPRPVAPPPPVSAPRAPVFSAPAENAKPADTNYFAWKESSEAEEEAPVFMKKDSTPGTAFLNRYATPNEIVSKTAALDGVDGALIALPDGLLVASKIPANMNADTIAAFLPQIFGRVSQCTRELRLGELNNLNFTVGNVPWKIFRVGAIYFAAFGRPGVPLPTAQLVGLAAELDRKAQ